MKPFFSTINYSSSNEDSNSEMKALDINTNDSVLCITGGGARPLDLLIKNPAEITAIDFNPLQNFLLELKAAAMRNMEYEEFLGFIGVLPLKNRSGVYKSICGFLTSEARSFWDNQLPILEKGVIYQGRWERYFRTVSKQLQWMHPFLCKKLFASTDLEEQKSLWNNQWDTFRWKLYLKCSSSKTIWKYLLADPGFYEYVPDDFSIYECLYNSFHHSFNHIKVSESSFAYLLFFGRYDPEGPLPIYLQRQNYKVIKDGLSSIRIVTGSLGEYLKGCTNSCYQKFSLSDFSSYTDKQYYEEVWKEIVRVGSTNARVCERQFLVKRELPESVKSKVIRLNELEEELCNSDGSMFYTFHIAEIRGKTNA